jgi:S1-C subfamily serine protease
MNYFRKRLVWFSAICVFFVWAGLWMQKIATAEDELEQNTEQSDKQQYDIEQSVVLIRCVQQDFDYITPWKQTTMVQGVGSGFVIAGNRILTNAHNVSNIRYVELKRQNFAKRYPAKVEFIGHDCDLAILSVFDQSFFEGTRPLEFGGILANPDGYL